MKILNFNLLNFFSRKVDFFIKFITSLLQYLLTRGSRIFFGENQNLRPANLFIIPFETRTQKNKNSTLIQLHSGAVCVSVFGQFWMGYHGSVPLKTQI